MAYENFNSGFYIPDTSTRPATLAEMVKNNVTDLLDRCNPDDKAVHAAFIRLHIDDQDAINAYAMQELEVIDAQDTVDRFADETRPETAAALAHLEELKEKQAAMHKELK